MFFVLFIDFLGIPFNLASKLFRTNHTNYNITRNGIQLERKKKQTYSLKLSETKVKLDCITIFL